VTIYKQTEFLVGHPILLELIISAIRQKNPEYYLSKDFPLYPKNGAFYIFQRDLMTLDLISVDMLTGFYKKIIYADNRLSKYYDICSTAQETKTQYELQGDFFETLTNAFSEIPDLKESLYEKVF
jgi:hypothetical protein